jgi:ribosomal protein S18 acetylase RimI-like enzyme
LRIATRLASLIVELLQHRRDTVSPTNEPAMAITRSGLRQLPCHTACTAASLHCLNSNTAALALYRGLGFTVVAALRGYYTVIDGVTERDGVLLVLALGPGDRLAEPTRSRDMPGSRRSRSSDS